MSIDITYYLYCQDKNVMVPLGHGGERLEIVEVSSELLLEFFRDTADNEILLIDDFSENEITDYDSGVLSSIREIGIDA